MNIKKTVYSQVLLDALVGALLEMTHFCPIVSRGAVEDVDPWNYAYLTPKPRHFKAVAIVLHVFRESGP